jgi:hypothetical protein
MVNNLVSLLENFARDQSPPNPLDGQIWWDLGTTRLKVYAGSSIGWKIISSATAQSSLLDGAPNQGPIAGDLWWDTYDEQLYTYNGDSPYSLAGWILVGPPYKKTKGKSGAIWETISDGTTNHEVLSIYLNGVRTSIVFNNIIGTSSFVPSPAILGFGRVNQGLTANTSVNSGQFYVTANNANYLGNQPASSYLRSDIDDTTDGVLTINNNGGLIIGRSSNLQITTTSGGAASIRNIINNGDINIYASIGGTDTLVAGLDGATGAATFLDINANGALIVANDTSVGGDVTVTGTGTFAGNLYAPTQPVDTADTTVATTEFVINNSGFLKNKIYAGGNSAVANTYIAVNDTGLGNATMLIDGITVLTASASGVNVFDGATAFTQPVSHQTNTALHQNYANSYPGGTAIATTRHVGVATQYWSGSAKWVSTSEPNPGVNDTGSADGDFWFQYEA